MEAAVLAAADAARRGDAVVLSPGCASFDWYPSGGYGARGDHFRRLVADLVDVTVDDVTAFPGHAGRLAD